MRTACIRGDRAENDLQEQDVDVGRWDGDLEQDEKRLSPAVFARLDHLEFDLGHIRKPNKLADGIARSECQQDCRAKRVLRLRMVGDMSVYCSLAMSACLESMLSAAMAVVCGGAALSGIQGWTHPLVGRHSGWSRLPSLGLRLCVAD